MIHDPKNIDVNFIKAGDILNLNVDSLKITALKLKHQIETLGYLIEEDNKAIALLYDSKGLPGETFEFLKKKHLRLAPDVDDPYQSNIDESARIGIKLADRVLISHISHKNLPFLRLAEYVRKNYGV